MEVFMLNVILNIFLIVVQQLPDARCKVWQLWVMYSTVLWFLEKKVCFVEIFWKICHRKIFTLKKPFISAYHKLNMFWSVNKVFAYFLFWNEIVEDSATDYDYNSNESDEDAEIEDEGEPRYM